MDRNEYWQKVREKFRQLVANFRERYKESVDPEFLPEIRLSEIQKFWYVSDYIIGYNGNGPVFDGGHLMCAYDDLVAGRRDYTNPQHLELDAYLQFEKWLRGEPTIWHKVPDDKRPESHKQKVVDSKGSKIDDNILKLQRALHDQDLNTFFVILKSIYASVPYHISRGSEKDFHRELHLILKLCGFDIESEVATNIGRIDAVLETEHAIFVMEFKITDAEKAMDQIRARKYYEKYASKKKQIILVGVAFDANENNIGDWISLPLDDLIKGKYEHQESAP